MFKRKVMGIFIILIGVLLLFDVTHIFEIGNILKYWPVLLILVGVLNIFDRGGINIGGIILTFVGTILLLDVLDIPFLEEVNWWSLLVPVIIIGIGLKILFPGGLSRPRQVSQDYFTQTVIFGGLDLEPQSGNFEGGEPIVLFGGMDLDLTKCQLSSIRPAKINGIVAFGGMDIYVPQEWTVKVKGFPIFGGISNRATQAINPHQVDLIVEGLVMFGGIEIKYKQ